MADWVQDLIEDRRRIFKTDGGKSSRWKIVKANTSRIIRKRKKKHNDYILARFNEETNPGKFFQHVNRLLGKNCEARWEPSKIFQRMEK